MRVIDRVYKREGYVKKAVEIEEELYRQVYYLSENVFEARASRIINMAFEHFINKKEYVAYKRPKGVDAVYRSLVIRKPFYDELMRIKETTGIPFNRLVNASIKVFLEDFKSELK